MPTTIVMFEGLFETWFPKGRPRATLKPTRGYQITNDGRQQSITCLKCCATSFNPNDVAKRYCGECHVFHEEGG